MGIFNKPIIKEENLNSYMNINKGDVFTLSKRDSVAKIFLGVKVIREKTVLYYCEEELVQSVSRNMTSINLNNYPYNNLTLELLNKEAYKVGNIYRYFEPVDNGDALELKSSFIEVKKINM